MNTDYVFLKRSIEILEALKQKTLAQGHPMLASLLDMAKSEAEDELRTAEKSDELRAAFFEGSVTTPQKPREFAVDS